jgi:hypothetical protein
VLDSYFLKDRDASRVRTRAELRSTIDRIAEAYHRQFPNPGEDLVKETWWRISTAIVRVWTKCAVAVAKEVDR